MEEWELIKKKKLDDILILLSVRVQTMSSMMLTYSLIYDGVISYITTFGNSLLLMIDDIHISWGTDM